MADIKEEIQAFQSAVYGEEVRSSMVSLAEKLNQDCETAASVITSEETRVKNEAARQKAEEARQKENEAVKELIENFSGDLPIASTTAPGCIKSGGDISVDASGNVTLNTSVFDAVIDKAILERSKKEHPVGDVLITYNNTNPATFLGFGTWSLFGQGRTLVGIDTADADFKTAGKTGGEKAHTLTVEEMPKHSHSLKGALSGEDLAIDNTGNHWAQTTESWDNSKWITETGGNGAHNNLQPYIVVYFWRRTA